MRMRWSIVGMLSIGVPAFAQDDAQTPAAEPVVVPATLLGQVVPVYPDEASPERLSGVVHVSVTVGLDGTVTAAVAEPNAIPEFVGPAVDAARQLKFTPALQDGQPVEAVVVVSFTFTPPVAEAVEEVDDPEEPTDIIVVEAKASAVPEAGAGDVRVAIDTIRVIPRDSAAKMLTVAPGVFQTQTGGAGHAEQVFMRGFDAREGQDVEFLLEGMPLNEVDNPHGHGLANTHFLIPEVISGVRIVEGPFDPSQGDFAVAGSAAFTLGLTDRGLTAKAEAGSFGTRRAFIGWRPGDSAGSFFAGEVFSTRGYGVNRGAQRGSAIARVDGEAGVDTKWHAIVGAYGAAYDSAGLLRREDVEANRIDAFGTYDTRQGGSSERVFATVGLDGERENGTWSFVAYVDQVAMRDRENFTGFLLDDRRPGESPHAQRGDLLEATYHAITGGIRAEARRPYSFEHLDGSYAAGLSGRFDTTTATARRLRDQDAVPYRTEIDAEVRQSDIAPWVDADATFADRVTLRAGLRAESFVYEVKDACAAKDGWYPGIARDQVNCPETDRYGARLQDASRTAYGTGLGPRGSIDLKLTQKLHWTTAAGSGVRSIEALSISEDEKAPFGRVSAGETGLVLDHSLRGGGGKVRLIGFTTHVNKDLVFDEEAGKNVIAGETSRYGAIAQSELYVNGLVARNSITYTYGVFGKDLPPSYAYYNSDRVAGKLIPYVPPWVLRSDIAESWDPTPWLSLQHGLGVDYIAPRPLPQSQRSDAVFTVDLATTANVGPVALGVSVTNALGARYALAEYNFSSWFPDVSGNAFPTRVPTRQVSPGPPRAVMVSVTFRPEAS